LTADPEEHLPLTGIWFPCHRTASYLHRAVGDLSPSEHLKLTYRVLIVLKFGGEDYYVDDDDDSSHPWSVSRDGARRPGPAARFTPTSSESRPPATESSSIKGIEFSHLIFSSPLHEPSQAAEIKESFSFGHQDCHVL
jgi:hypothetical protein